MKEKKQSTAGLSLAIKIVALFVTVFTIPTYAVSPFSLWQDKSWRSIVAIGGGVLSTSKVGQSKSFPIRNPITDEFYIYSAHSKKRDAGFFDFFVAAESQLHPNWLSQIGLNYNQASHVSAYGTLIQGADIGSEDIFAYHYKVLIRQLLIQEKLLYKVNERYYPYVMGGLGLGFNKAGHYSTNVPPFLTFTRMYQNKTSTSFSYALGIGVDTQIATGMRLGIGYRFADLGQVKLGQARIDTTLVYGRLSQSHLYTNAVLAQLIWII